MVIILKLHDLFFFIFLTTLLLSFGRSPSSISGSPYEVHRVTQNVSAIVTYFLDLIDFSVRWSFTPFTARLFILRLTFVIVIYHNAGHARLRQMFFDLLPLFESSFLQKGIQYAAFPFCQWTDNNVISISMAAVKSWGHWLAVLG